MTLGQKIKRIRIFRGMTQKELGNKVGYGESSADVRIAQYEAGKRTPKRETILSMAEILKVNPSTFGCEDDRNGMELLQMFLWLEEENGSEINLFPIQQAKDQVGLWIGNQEMNRFLRKWMRQKELLKEGCITEQEYLEWKWKGECWQKQR